ncbi:MAG: hypothetical protein M1820_006802 [Bogoriella megaspora]|nr:MAG: hypothetical protein M1820_006802 [Bogoriella megaspora]
MSDPTTTPQIFYHSTLYPSSLPNLLRSVLPTGLPLYRRLQFPLRSGFEFLISTFPVSTTVLPKTFCIAWVDRSRRPESQCFLFSSLEAEHRWYTEFQSPENYKNAEDYGLGVAQLRAVLLAIRNLPYPPSQDEDGYEERKAASIEARRRAEPEGREDPLLSKTWELSDKDKLEKTFIMLGAIHNISSRIIQDDFKMVPKDLWGIEGVWAASYRKWLFSTDTIAQNTHVQASDPTKRLQSARTVAETTAAAGNPDGEEEFENLGNEGLPDGLYWSAMQEQDLTTVRSRTHIPRRERTMRLLPSICIRRHPSFKAPAGALPPPASAAPHSAEPPDPDGSPAAAPLGPNDPIAWAFLGVDASLSSLHVEPGFRGLGLAKAVAGKLFTDGMVGTYGMEDGERWAHSDVADDNESSIGVMKSLQGRKGAEHWWMRVHLGVL